MHNAGVCIEWLSSQPKRRYGKRSDIWHLSGYLGGERGTIIPKRDGESRRQSDAIRSVEESNAHSLLRVHNG